MSRRRYISTQISTDTAVNKLAQRGGDFAALLYTWMIPHAADDATLPGDPEELIFIVIPGRRDKTPDDVADALRLMVDLELIEWDRELSLITFNYVRWRKEQSYTEGRIKRKPWQKIRHKVRPRILERDGYQCLRCGSTERLEVDHIVPIMHGGTNDDTNLQTLCRPCNRKKWAFLPHEEVS